MIYLKRSNRPERGKTATILIVTALVFVFGIGYLFPGAYPSMLYPVASLFWRAEAGTVSWFVSMAEIVQSKYALVKENKALSDEVAADQRSMLELSAVKDENEALKNILGRTGKGNYVLGVILVRPPVSPYDTFIIDAGTSVGVKVGDKVYADGDTLVGDIVEAYPGQSKVSLFSTPGRTISVLLGTSTVATEATGRGGGDFVMTLPTSIHVAVGEPVIVPQIEPHSFGAVEDVSPDTTDSIETILFKSAVNINQLAFVEVDATRP
ncbi:MAG: rod shape-determining protein MreC [Patescibacteria group bacterium]|nr:rod shape-determining protein MreC [Patescibacteria group bacterium]MDE2116389.1 rod shape-determining protein MreC [Patescibacteria group bacterium]